MSNGNIGTIRYVSGEGPVVANRRTRIVVRLIIAILGAMFCLYPFLIIVTASFDPTNSLSGQTILPTRISLINYEKVLSNEQTPILRWLFNSITVSGISAVVTLLLTTFAAYSFSRFRYAGRQASLQATLLVQIFPSVLGLVAFYLLLQQIGEYIPWLGLNSLGGLIIIYTGGALGANAWLMKGYFDTIPREIDEAALVDGATHWIIFTQILVPLIRPILIVIGFLSFISSFNDYLIPRVLLRDKDVFTLAVGLTTFFDNQFSVNWGVFAAGALIGTLPIIVLFLVLQTQLISGLSTGAVKG